MYTRKIFLCTNQPILDTFCIMAVKGVMTWMFTLCCRLCCGTASTLPSWRARPGPWQPRSRRRSSTAPPASPSPTTTHRQPAVSRWKTCPSCRDLRPEVICEIYSLSLKYSSYKNNSSKIFRGLGAKLLLFVILNKIVTMVLHQALVMM